MNLISGRTTFNDPGSDACFSVAKGFLEECLQNHPLCRPVHTPSQLSASGSEAGNAQVISSPSCPTRTIEVGPPDGSREPYLSIHSKGECMIQWTTVSHVWGGQSPLMTTTASLQEMQRGIPMATLPPLFQDAIVITRKLGFRHLWIDSLCIIQDCPQDWESESHQMANIYHNSSLNIATEESRSCYDRILGQRDLAFSPIRIPFTSSKRGVSGGMFIRPRLDHWPDVLLNSSLSSRAWALQESILARRTLHYCHQQMLWECRTMITAEGDVAPTRDSILHKNWIFLPKMFTDASNVGSIEEPARMYKAREAIYKYWYSLVENYTSRKLTKQGDRLPARTGVASFFHVQLDDTYNKGLFEGDFHRGLAWRTRDPSTATYPATWRAPSWSWVSVESPVTFYCLNFKGLDHQCQAKIHAGTYFENYGDRLHTQQEPTAPCGSQQINSAPAVADGSLAEADVRACGDAVVHSTFSNFDQVAGGRLFLSGPWQATDKWSTAGHNKTVLWLKGHLTGDQIYCYFDVGDEQQIAERSYALEKFSFMRILSYPIPRMNAGHMYILILESAGHNNPDEYRRIGSATVWSDEISRATEGWEMRAITIV